MTHLPAPYSEAFSQPAAQLRESIEKILRGQDVRDQAFESFAFQHQARQHFVVSALAFEKRHIDKLGVYVATMLALNARPTLENRLEVKGSMTKFAESLKMAWSTFLDRVVKLETCGLIKVLERGSGKGHPHHIRLVIREHDHAEIGRRAAEEIEHHFRLQEQRSSVAIPLLR